MSTGKGSRQDNEDCALADIQDIKALTRLSASWVYEAVRGGRFPQPVIRGVRCTRWRLSDVRAWLLAQSAGF